MKYTFPGLQPLLVAPMEPGPTTMVAGAPKHRYQPVFGYWIRDRRFQPLVGRSEDDLFGTCQTLSKSSEYSPLTVIVRIAPSLENTVRTQICVDRRWSHFCGLSAQRTWFSSSRLSNHWWKSCAVLNLDPSRCYHADQQGAIDFHSTKAFLSNSI